MYKCQAQYSHACNQKQKLMPTTTRGETFFFNMRLEAYLHTLRIVDELHVQRTRGARRGVDFQILAPTALARQQRPGISQRKKRKNHITTITQPSHRNTRSRKQGIVAMLLASRGNAKLVAFASC